MDRDKILLTPGPLTTTLQTKLAMLRDWGSWDSDFNELTARVRDSLLKILNAQATHVVVPLQGSGTFSVEAAVTTVVPRDGHLLVLDNGAYCKRAVRIAEQAGRKVSMLSFDESQAVDPLALATKLDSDKSITQVFLVHCETGTGVLNPLQEVADVCARYGVGLIVDAMSSFGALNIDAASVPFDALIAASGKCLEGVPGMGFVFLKKSLIERCKGNCQSLSMDLIDQYHYMERTGQWRFTPPTHVVAALHEAIRQFNEEGGQSARLARYRANCAALISGMTGLGLKLFLEPRLQAPIIVTFHAPTFQGYSFKALYESVRAKGFVLYPGKLTSIETFRVGCIGAIEVNEIEQAVHAVSCALSEFRK